uniref:Uncharacterized protein n=1 Tax=Siphoviridae sp. ctMOb8 TaxID=2825460 RepID=A0A8S5PYR8_9CAUD|nr:MAG TPA: hypothetical protein [Siphoviridae sp. ctMOb8]
MFLCVYLIISVFNTKLKQNRINMLKFAIRNSFLFALLQTSNN